MIGNLRAIAFVLSDLETGRLLGHALVCQEARYVSIAHAVAGPLERLHASPQQWRAMASDLTLGLPPTPLPADGAFARCSCPTAGAEARCFSSLTELDVNPATPAETAPALDKLLRGLACQ